MWLASKFMILETDLRATGRTMFKKTSGEGRKVGAVVSSDPDRFGGGFVGGVSRYDGGRVTGCPGASTVRASSHP